MAEENENIVEEISNETPEQVEQPKVEQPRNEKGQFKSKFDSVGDDNIIKVELDQPPPPQETEKIEEIIIQSISNLLDSKTNEESLAYDILFEYAYKRELFNIISLT